MSSFPPNSKTKKEDDPFIEASHQGIVWLQNHRVLLFAILGTLIALLLGFLVWQSYQGRQRQYQADKLSKVWHLCIESAIKGDSDEIKPSVKKMAQSRNQKQHKADKDLVDNNGSAEPREAQKDSKEDSKQEKSVEDDEDNDEEDDDDSVTEENDETDEEQDDLARKQMVFSNWQEKSEKSIPVLQELKSSSNVGLSALASLLLSDTYEHIDAKEKSDALLLELVQKIPDTSPLYFLVLERRAYLREESHDLDGAVDTMDPLASNEQRYYSDRALLNQARWYGFKGEIDKAQQILDRLENDFPHSDIAEEAQSMLASMHLFKKAYDASQTIVEK